MDHYVIIRQVGGCVEECRLRDALVGALSARYRFARFSGPIDDGGSVWCETPLDDWEGSPMLTLMREFAHGFAEAWRERARR